MRKTHDQCNTPLAAWRNFRNEASYPVQVEEHIKVAFMAGIAWGAAKARNESQRIAELAARVAGVK